MDGRQGTRWLGVLASVASVGCTLSAEESQVIVVTPGQDIQAAVELSPEGARFHLQPGIYRQQTVYPKDRQEFIGQDGAILSGAMELTAWRKRADFWLTKGLPPPLDTYGGCASGRDLCELREDLFFNGRLFERVGSLAELEPGRWYYEDGRAYLADDPIGQSVELGVTPLAFGGEAGHVVLENLIVEKYASLAQYGAIDSRDARGWLISDVTARWNHGVGLTFGPATQIRGGAFNHNGQLGLKGTGDRVIIEGVEIAWNNYAGYESYWEAGGTKFYETDGLVVRDSCIHHNAGPGLWTDTDNINVTYDNNRVFLNARDGIKHEVSYRATIRNNVVSRNGYDFDVWLWGSQILIQNSQDVRVYGNIVEISNRGGNGISVIYQDRGIGKYGPWNSMNNYVKRNIIIHLGAQGQNGMVTDAGHHWFEGENNNRFNSNSYVVVDEGGKHWQFDDLDLRWDETRELGYERSGELIVERRSAMALSCDR